MILVVFCFLVRKRLFYLDLGTGRTQGPPLHFHRHFRGFLVLGSWLLILGSWLIILGSWLIILGSWLASVYFTWIWGPGGLVPKRDVSELKNGDKLPVLFSINCLTGQMDYSSDCFVEAALKNPNGGAVSALGSTRVSYSWWNDRLCDGFYTCLYGTEVYDCLDTGVQLPAKHSFSKKLGVVLNFGKMYLALNYPSNPFGTAYDYTETEFYLFHCIGDPEMQIWTGTLQDLQVAQKRGKNNLSLQVTNKNTRKSIVDATVCLYGENTQIVVKTNANGNCTLPVTATGTFTLTITGENVYPYQTQVTID